MIKQKIDVQTHKSFALSLLCARTNKPIIITNNYGMYCDEMCDANQDRDKANLFRDKLEEIMNTIKW